MAKKTLVWMQVLTQRRLRPQLQHAFLGARLAGAARGTKHMGMTEPPLMRVLQEVLALLRAVDVPDDLAKPRWQWTRV